jgi:hypothetical protein
MEIINALYKTLDSMQEEPTIPDIVDEHFWEMLGEEPATEDLESWDEFSHIDDAIEDYCCFDSHIVFFTESLNGEPLEEADDREQVESAFKAGANWQKQQMLKGAKLAALKDATVAEYWDNWLILDPYLRGSFKDGEKVKIVILKE